MISSLFLALVAVADGAPTAARPPVIVGQSGDWRETLERVVPAVVSLRVTATRDFDTEDAESTQGTGFIVDAERGLILTNRHMVQAGPVVAEAVFLDNEEIALEAIYRDPVHDFGFFRFDPDDVEHMEVVSLELAPEGARVGIDIRVIGNDAGEKVSILDGTLARLDRNAPDYGVDAYNDFNTFYLQAASNTSGGSSGSPVVDREGRVVALNAGGNVAAASSFYLPLDRVVRALERIRAGEPVVRGTLQAVFEHTPFDELGRLGLTDATEVAARAEGHGTGMLVVRQVLPEGPADGRLKVGDVLVSVGGELVTEFVPLEAQLDGHVGTPVAVVVERGGVPVVTELTPQDLHAITPDTYLEVGRGVLHELSYQQARNHARPVHGVYVAVPGYMLSTADVPEGAVITHLDGVEVPTLDRIQEVLEATPADARVRVRFNAVADARHSYETVAVMDRRWFPMRRCRRDDAAGSWRCVESPAPPPARSPEPPSSILMPRARGPAGAVAASLVLVDFDIPYPTAGVNDFNYVGVGTVLDAEHGLVLVDRDTVPVALGDMMLTFAGSVRVPGRLRYLHPVHNLAILSYDPALLGDTPVRAATWSNREPEVGDLVWQVGLDHDQELAAVRTRIDEHEPLLLGLSPTPRHRDANVEGYDIAEAEASLGGVLADRKGRVVALWASFFDQREGDRAFYGLPRAFVEPVLGPLRAGRDPRYRTLGAELVPLGLAEARDRGLSDARIRQLLDHDPERRQVLEVMRLHGASHAAELLRHTDLLLEVDGRPVTRMPEIEALHGRDQVRVTILRDAEEHTFDLKMLPLSGNGVDRIAVVAGMVLHRPHYEVEAQQGIEGRGVYVAWLWYGSPAHRYGFRPTRRIVSVDEVPTPDLETLLAVIDGKADGEAIRLTLEGLDGSTHVQTLKLDLEFWPTQRFERGDGEWNRVGSASVTADRG